MQALTRPTGLQAISDQVFGLLQHVHRLVQHQLANLGQVRAGQAALPALLQRADHAIEARLHIQQGARHIHECGVIRHAFTLGQRLQGQYLIDDDPPRLLKAQDRKGIGYMTQGGQQGVQLFAVLTIPAHELVQTLLDTHQVVAQCADHRTQGVTPRPCLNLLTPIAQRQV
ncbi:hypothetical protein D3C75_991470 [compost metagenome]